MLWITLMQYLKQCCKPLLFLKNKYWRAILEIFIYWKMFKFLLNFDGRFSSKNEEI